MTLVNLDKVFLGVSFLDMELAIFLWCQEIKAYFQKIVNAQENSLLRARNGISLGADARGVNSNCRGVCCLSFVKIHDFCVPVSILVVLCFFTSS